MLHEGLSSLVAAARAMLSLGPRCSPSHGHVQPIKTRDWPCIGYNDVGLIHETTNKECG